METILARGIFNTRPRDYYDVYILGTTQPYDRQLFLQALAATAEHRGSTEKIADHAAILQNLSASDDMRNRWKKYQERFVYAREISYEDILSILDGILA